MRSSISKLMFLILNTVHILHVVPPQFGISIHTHTIKPITDLNRRPQFSLKRQGTSIAMAKKLFPCLYKPLLLHLILLLSYLTLNLLLRFSHSFACHYSLLMSLPDEHSTLQHQTQPQSTWRRSLQRRLSSP